jgi:hypothetical protein
MNYQSIYQKLISNAKARVRPECYCEKHHIVPRALGGSDDDSNLVILTSREHFIAHALLARIHGGLMWQALIIMKGGKGKKRYINSRLFDAARKISGIEREKSISDKRKIDPKFDEHIHRVRSNATKFRQEGYQAEAGQKFKEKFSSDEDFANKIRHNRSLAQKASTAVKRIKSDEMAKRVVALRASGMKYDEIKNMVQCSMGFISKVINNAKIS